MSGARGRAKACGPAGGVARGWTFGRRLGLAAWGLLAPLLVVPVMLVMLAGMAHAVERATPTGAEVKAAQARVITVGLLADWAPLQSWAEGGDPQGLDVAVLRELARATGLPLVFQRYTDRASLWRALSEGRVQLLATSADHQPDAGPLVLSRPYAALPMAMLAPVRLYAVASLPDLGGRRMALVTGTEATARAERQFPLAARQAFVDRASAVAALQAGQADLLLDLEAVLQQQVARTTGLQVLRTPVLPPLPRRLAALPRDAAVLALLDEALAAVAPKTLTAWHREALAPPPVAASAPAPGSPAPARIGPLRVGYDTADWPYTQRNEAGVPEGLGIALVQAVARRTGFEILELVPLAEGEAEAALASGRVDLLMGVAASAQANRQMTLVGPYQLSPLAIVTRERYSASQLHLLAGRRLAVPRGLAARPWLPLLYPGLVLVDCASEADGLDQLNAGAADAVLTKLQGLPWRLRVRADDRLHLTGVAEGLYQDGHLALGPAHAVLAPRLRQALNQVLADDLETLEQQWADRREQPGVPWERVRKWVMAATITALLLLLGWILHGQVLRREQGRTQAALQRADLYMHFLAHDVRNALQSVLGALALWRGGAALQRVSSEALVEALTRSAATTVGQLDGLLDQQRLQSGTLGLQRRPESLRQVLRDIVDEVQAAARAKGQTIVFAPPLSVTGWWQLDAFRLQQVLRNLLNHALRGNRVTQVTLEIALQHSPRGAGWGLLVVAVHDQGPALDERERGRLFDVDDAGDTIPQDAPPIPVTNRGLRLARDLTLAMGGTLEVQSPGGRGNGFILHLNLEAAGGLHGTADGAQTPRLRQVLLVEDDPAYGLLLQEALAAQGIQAVLVDSVASAGDRLVEASAPGGRGAEHVDLVLCDSHLGDGGLAELLLLGRQRQAQHLPMPPVIGMSADFDTADIERLSALGALDLLTKDADLADLVRRLQRSWATQADT